MQTRRRLKPASNGVLWRDFHARELAVCGNGGLKVSEKVVNRKIKAPSCKPGKHVKVYRVRYSHFATACVVRNCTRLRK